MLAYPLAYETNQSNLFRRDLTSCEIRVFVLGVVGKPTFKHTFS